MSRRHLVRGVVIVCAVAIVGWVSTAPYLSNEGLGRLPGLIIGGTATEAPADFSQFNGVIAGPLMMKQAGFPPFVNYPSWVGAAGGVTPAPSPDNAPWPRRARAGGAGAERLVEPD